ncbi:hypothetical protein ACE6H2_015741 [Prunus campanulata]
MSESGSSQFGMEDWERDWDPRDESEEGDEDEEAELAGREGGLVDDEVEMEDEVVAERIGQYSIDKVKNEMTEGEIENLRLEYGIPGTIELRLPRKDEKASQPPDGSVLIHPGFFECGFKLPLHPYVHKFLSTLGLAPMQVNPNVYIAWLSMYVLWKQLGLGEPSFAQFTNQYCLKKHPDRWARPSIRVRKLKHIVRVRAERSSIERSGKRLTTPSILAEFELASPKDQGSMSPEKRARNPGSRLAESLRRALEEQRKAEQRKGGGGGKVSQPTIPVDGDPGPLRVIPTSTPFSQPNIMLDGDGSYEKDREVDMTAREPDPKKRRVDGGDIHQHQANPSGQRIHSAFTSFFRTCQLGIRDSKLEGFEGKSPNGKIDMALQATLELETRGLLQKQSYEIKELGKKSEDSDLLTAKLRSVVDLEKKKVSDTKSELKSMAEKHAKDLGVLQEQVAKLTSEVAELRSTKDKVIIEFKSSDEFEGLKSTCLDEGFQSCMKAMRRCYPTLDWTILEGALARGELDLSDGVDDGAPFSDMRGPIVGEVETGTSEVGVHDETVTRGAPGDDASLT